MKASEMRKLIGKNIEWIEGNCPWRGGILHRGIVIEVSGRNVRIYQHGIEDWKWLPNMTGVKEVV